MGRISSHPLRTAVLMVLLFAGCSAAAGENDLFVPFTEGEAALDASQRQFLDKLRGRPSHRVIALVKINQAAFGRASVNFNLTADTNFRASHLVADQSGDSGRLTWQGDLDEGAGKVLLSGRNDSVTGTISAREGVYQVRPLGSGVHAIVWLNPAGFPPDHPEDH